MILIKPTKTSIKNLHFKLISENAWWENKTKLINANFVENILTGQNFLNSLFKKQLKNVNHVQRTPTALEELRFIHKIVFEDKNETQLS